MPIYQYQGQEYEMAEEDPAVAKSRILAYLDKQKAAEQPQGPVRAPEDAPDFTRGVGNIVPQLQNVASGAKALTGVVAKKLGFDETGDSLIASGLQGMKESEAKMVVKDSDEFTEAWEKGIGTVVTEWLPYQAGAGVGSLLETLGFMAVGAGAGAVGGVGVGALPGAVGGAISKSLIKQGIKEAAEKIVKEQGKEAAEKFVINEAKKAAVKMGATAGMIGQAGMHGIGEVGGRAIEEAQERGLTPEDINLYKTLPAAGVHAVADFISNKIMLGALSPTDKAGKSLALEIAKRITTTGAKELVPEEVQTIAERFGAELSLTDAEAIKEYVNTAAASFGMSVVPGTIGGVRSRFSSKLREDANAAKEESEKKTSAGTLDKAATEVNGTQDPAILAKLQPTVDADGNPLAASSQTTIDATNEVKDVIAQNNQIKQEEAPKESIYEAPKKEAADYLANIESQAVKPNASILKKHVKALGLEVPAGAGFSERAVQAIKTTLGEANVPVTNVNDTTGGVGAAVSGQQAGVPAGGTTTTVAQGLGGAPAAINVPAVGAPTQQPPLVTPTATSAVAAPPVATPAFTPAAPSAQQTTSFTPEAQLRQAMIEEDQRKAAEEEQQRLAFEEAQRKTVRRAPQMPEIQEEYEGTRQEFEALELPAWEKLSAVEKDVYLEGIKDNTIAEHNAAARKLAEYREGQQDSLGTKGLKPSQIRTVNMYEENRKTYSNQMGIQFPSWGELSDNARNAYLDEVVNNTPIEQDFGFIEIAKNLEAEGRGIRGAAKVDIESAKLAGQSEESKAVIQERVAKEKAAEESALGKGERLPQEAINLLKTDVNKFLEWMSANGKGLIGLKPAVGDKTYRPAVTKLAKTRNRAIEIIFKYLGARLSRIDFTGMTVVTENNPMLNKLRKEGKLAEYHPKTNILYITKEGLDQATVLHELIHAATVKLISRYYSNPNSLRPEEREAVEHLEKLFDFTKKQLGGKFKNAYENIYEFITYGLTDNKFQLALSQIQARPLAKYTLMMKNAWRQFTQALSKMFGLYDAKASKEALPAEMYQQVAKEYSSMDPNELYQEKVMEEMEELDIVIAPPTLAEPKPKERDIKVKKVRVPKQAEKFITIAPGFEGNVLLEMAEVFERIASAPVPVNMQPLAARTEGAEAKKAPEMREGGIDGDDAAYDVKEKDQSKNLRTLSKLFLTAPGWREIATKFQNSRYHIKYWQDKLDLAGLIQDEGRDKINNIYTQLTLSASSAKNFYNQYVKDADERLQKAVIEFAKESGLDVDKGLNKLFRILEALHDGERRHEKFLMIVPLSNDRVLNGGQISPADRRAQIYEILNSNVKLSESQKQQLKAELEAIVKKYADPLGSSPRSSTKKDGTRVPLSVDEQNEIYNVTGLSPAARDLRLQQFNALPARQKELADNVIASLGELHNATTELNKIGNYWSQPVSNLVGFYNFKNYIPLKGITEANEDQMLDFDSERMGRELQDIEHSFDGRTTVSNNPILQSRADATRAAMRAGRKDLTQSIKNAITKNAEGKQVLAGYIKKTLTFAERRDSKEIDKLKGENTLFHYNEDGSVDVLVVQNKEQREAIRRTYKDTKPFVDYANRATSFLGALHTRYNYNFAPLNFVRDALTNAYTMSAEMGPGEAARYIKAIAGRSLQGGMAKAIDISVAYEAGDTAALARMKKSDPIAADMIEYIERGGMVSYLQGLSIKSNFQSLQKELGRGRIARGKEQVDKLVDIWTDMFELSSRSAAYAVTKRYEMSKGKSEEAATIRAVAYAKNLANFEQVGDFGKTMGAFYMFYRPAATGAVRAIESVIPAFRTLEGALEGLPSTIKDDPQALKTYKENYAARQRNARITLAASTASGMIIYAMAQMLADDDDLGRNKVEADNMQQWTRFARFHLPKSLTGEKDYVVQIPWGFGLGAFAAAGAQLAGGVAGKGSMGDALWNTATQISLDSFIPIPVSRMDASVDPLPFFLDSVMPSTLRPVLEFVINKNGLGQDIYSDKNRRMGDAYTGSDRIPEIYRDLARELANSTGGYIDWSPNTVYFLANSYLDGIAKVGELGYGTLDIMRGNKSFDAKKDLPLVGSFIGAKSNYDSREFTKVENQIKEIERILNMFKEDPVQYAKYVSNNPFAEVLVEQYNSNINGNLKQIRADLNTFRKMKLPQKERKEIVDALTLQSNIIKRGMIEEFKAYGIKP
jgi:hypothetical protein